MAHFSRRSIDSGIDSKSISNGHLHYATALSNNLTQISLNSDPLSSKRDSRNIDNVPDTMVSALRRGDVELAVQISHLNRWNGLKCSKQKSFELLEAAIQSRSISSICFLQEARIPMTAVNQFNENGLHMAVRLGCLDIVEYLALSEPYLTARKDLNGNTPLHLACRIGNSEIVIGLCAAGAPINEQNQEGFTPNMCAILGGHLKCCITLLSSGCRLDLIDRRGNTALHLASEHGHYRIVQLLCETVQNLGDRNVEGQTALHLAAKHGHLEIVRTLLLAGADPRERNMNGITSDVIAFAQGHKDIGMLITRIKPERIRAWQDQLLRNDQRIQRIKIKIFGSTMVGKTQLSHTLRTGYLAGYVRKKISNVSEMTGIISEQPAQTIRRNGLPYEWSAELQHENYSHGIDIHETNEFSFWEFSGYPPYLCLYDHFIGDTNCVHLVVFNLMDDLMWQRASVEFWLHFLHARMPTSEPLLPNGQTSQHIRVALVATHEDVRMTEMNDLSHAGIEEEIRRNLEPVLDQFNTKFHIADRIFFIDTRDATSSTVKQLKSYLSDCRKEIRLYLPRANALLNEVISALHSWTADEAFPVDTWKQFNHRIREHINPLCSDLHLAKLVEHLQYCGHIAYIESPSGNDLIILSSPWLCSHFMSRIFKHDILGRNRVTGSYTMDDFQLFVRPCHTLKLITLLDALGICVCVSVQEEGDDSHRITRDKSRSRRRKQIADRTDFFQHAKYSSYGCDPVGKSKRTIFVLPSTDLEKVGNEFNEEIIQFEIPVTNMIRNNFLMWTVINNPSDRQINVLYSGLQISAQAGQLIHLFPRIQTKLRYVATSLVASAFQDIDIPSGWDLNQWFHGSKFTILEGVVEIILCLPKHSQDILLISRTTPKHTKQTYKLLHNVNNFLHQFLGIVCPNLEFSANLLHVTSACEYLNRINMWSIEDLTRILWKLYQRKHNCSNMALDRVEDLIGTTERGLINALCFQNKKILPALLNVFTIPLKHISYAAIRRLASLLDAKLVDIKFDCDNGDPISEILDQITDFQTTSITAQFVRSSSMSMGQFFFWLFKIRQEQCVYYLMRSFILFQLNWTSADDPSQKT